MSNVTLLPDHMLGEVIARTHDHDLLAFLSSCKTFKRVLALDTAREVKPPPGAHVVKSLALLEWALGSGWAWPTKNKNGEEDCFAARHPGTQRRCGGVEVARPRYATACSRAAGGRCIAVLQGARADGCGWAPPVSSVREWTTNFGCWFRTCAQ